MTIKDLFIEESSSMFVKGRSGYEKTRNDDPDNVVLYFARVPFAGPLMTEPSVAKLEP